MPFRDWEGAPGGDSTAYGRIGIFRRPDGQIGMSLGTGPGEISTVAQDPTRRRGHPHLYSKLREILITVERWPLDSTGRPVP
jgi:hypothetical protein